ncbi:hypothetical protein DVH24_022681 [Malus domestica]|uniref:Uncharacterized protein n=1 Tax=Malus domestica TaxID=3750 RepID=A0A498KM20_MALDO|nr:hypothetical protein DVH24_022681 [Malus domestica]
MEESRFVGLAGQEGVTEGGMGEFDFSVTSLYFSVSSTISTSHKEQNQFYSTHTHPQTPPQLTTPPPFQLSSAQIPAQVPLPMSAHCPSINAAVELLKQGPFSPRPTHSTLFEALQIFRTNCSKIPALKLLRSLTHPSGIDAPEVYFSHCFQNSLTLLTCMKTFTYGRSKRTVECSNNGIESRF